MADINLKAAQPVGAVDCLTAEVEDLRKRLAAKEASLAAAVSAAGAVKEDKKEDKPNAEGDGEPAKLSKKDLKKLEKQKAKDAKKAAAAPQQAAIEFVPEVFGPMPLIQSKGQSGTKWTEVGEVVESLADSVITIRARIHASRKNSAKLAFLVLRKQVFTIQTVLAESSGLPRDCIKWAASLPLESIVEVVGKVVKPAEPVTACSQSLVELQIQKIHLVSSSTSVLPFQLPDACVGDEGADDKIRVNQDTRLETRWLDMRTPANQAIWTIKARICQYFREFLTKQQFVEIQTPKIIPAASEGGAEVFKLNYFGRHAFLAQSPQLYKQIALQGDLARVFEVGPVFRSENSNTHRHLCEFIGLDVELEIKEHYYEVLDVAEGLFTYIFDELAKNCAPLIDAVNKQWNHGPFVHKMTQETIEKLGLGVLNGEGARESTDEFKGMVHTKETATLRMSYPNAVRLLNTILPDEDFDRKMAEDEDLDTTNEKKLGALVKKRYGVDFFILDWFPASVRPFYTMPHPENPKFSNSYDMFMRGEEISSGAQRIHDPALLEKRGAELGVDMKPLADYINSFRQGGWPHGGFGVGLERVVMLFLGMHNIRSCSLFPRDPKRNTP